MGIKSKSLTILALSGLMLLGSNLLVNNPAKVQEGAYDEFNQSPTLNLRKEGYIGADEEVAYSNIFAQYGVDAENNYWIRFATAIKGNIESLSYVRNAIEELGETDAVEKAVTTVYRGVSSKDVVTYYNAETGLSTDEADAGNYYWACYSIQIKNSAYYSSTIAMSLKIGDEVVTSRAVSLNSLLGVEHTYRFEAEDAIITGESSSGNVETSAHYHHPCFETSTYVSPNFSGDICLRNNYGLTLEFDFVSSVKDDFAKFRLNIASGSNTKLSNLYTITVNDNALDLTGIITPKGETSVIEGNSYFKMVEVDVPVSLLKGNNKVTIAHGEGSSTANIDYLEVITSSEVSGFVPTPFMNSEDVSYSIEVMPTHRTEGKLKVTCEHEEYGAEHGSTSYVIPNLTDTEFYSLSQDENNVTNVRLSTFGEKVVASYKDSYELKLSGATFSDGLTAKTFTIEEIIAGLAEEELANAVLIIPEGKKLYGWYDTKSQTTVSTSDYKMLYSDAELEAMFQPTEYVQSGNGYLDLGVQASGSYWDNAKNIKNYSNTNKRTLGRMAPNTIGTILDFDCTADTSLFRIKTAYSVGKNVQYEIEYTVSNLGSDTISFDLDQVNSGTNAAGFRKSLTLAPGEVTTFTLTFKFSSTNGHLLTLLSFASKFTGCSLGIAAKITTL